jgi:GNAT superfamily N-acetyltransferase
MSMVASDSHDLAGGQPRIRRARPDEIPEITRLIVQAHAETYAPPEVDIADYVAGAAAKAKRQRRFWRTYLVAEAEGRIVGAVQTMHDLVVALYVDRGWRGRGVGARLLSAAEAALRAKGVGRAQVQIADGYPRVRAFYERHGWEVGRDSEPRRSADWGLRLLQLSKEIGPREEARHRKAGVALKAIRIGLGAALVFPALALLRFGGGLTSHAAIAALLLALLAVDSALSVRHLNFSFARNLLAGASGVIAYLTLPLAAVVLGALALQAFGLEHLPVRVRSDATLAVSGLLLVATRWPAHRLLVHCLQRFL